jgi:hypothetical protein
MLPFLDNTTRTIEIGSLCESLIRIVECYRTLGFVFRGTVGPLENWTVVGELIVSVLSAQRDRSYSGAAS